MQPILTIGITSYKRVNELKRCLKSIQTKYQNEIEILVSEDHSPLSNEIKAAVEEIKKESPYKIIFSSNEKNIGYDMNLGTIIQKSEGEYIFFLSDDDEIYGECLDEIISFLRINKNYGVLYAPFVYSDSGKKDRNHEVNFEIVPGLESSKRYIYDSILFSGLIFKRDLVKKIDSSRFKNMNYFQVYLFLTMLYKYGGYYFKTPSILCVGDGENAYGLSESSGGNSKLADRTNVKSNLEFNRTLIEVIRMFDEDNKTDILSNFAKQYTLHSYTGLSIARSNGVKFFNEYWKILNSLNIKMGILSKVYYIILLILGKKKSDILLAGFRKKYKKED